MAYAKILVGTDGSASASVAVREAIDIARGVGAELLVLSAYKEHRANAQQAVDEAVVAAKVAGVGAEGRLVEGEAAAVMLDTAVDYGADLVVVGNRGMAGTARFLLGSVPDKVSHHAPCDLLIVYGTQE